MKFKLIFLPLFTILLATFLVRPTYAHEGSCADASLWIENPYRLDNASQKYPFPVNQDFTLHVEVRGSKVYGNSVTFASYNPWIQLVNGGEISDGGTTTGQTNFKVTWPKGNDGDLTLRAKILSSNLIRNTNRGNLITIGAQIAGAKCGPKLELYGVPSN